MISFNIQSDMTIGEINFIRNIVPSNLTNADDVGAVTGADTGAELDDDDDGCCCTGAGALVGGVPGIHVQEFFVDICSCNAAHIVSSMNPVKLYFCASEQVWIIPLTIIVSFFVISICFDWDPQM